MGGRVTTIFFLVDRFQEAGRSYSTSELQSVRDSIVNHFISENSLKFHISGFQPVRVNVESDCR